MIIVPFCYISQNFGVNENAVDLHVRSFQNSLTVFDFLHKQTYKNLAEKKHNFAFSSEFMTKLFNIKKKWAFSIRILVFKLSSFV